VASTYFKPERRGVILYYTKAAPAGAAAADPLLEGLSDQEKAQVTQMRAMIQQMPVEQAKLMLQKLEQAEGQAPPEAQKTMKAIKAILQQKIGKGE